MEQQFLDIHPNGKMPKNSGWSTDAMHFLVAFMIKEDETLSSFANNGMMVAKKKQAFQCIQEQFNCTFPEQYKTMQQIRSKMKSLRHQAKTIACYRHSNELDQVPPYLVSLVHMLQRKGVTMNVSPPITSSFISSHEGKLQFIASASVMEAFANNSPAPALDIKQIKVESEIDCGNSTVEIVDPPCSSSVITNPSVTATAHTNGQLINFASLKEMTTAIGAHEMEQACNSSSSSSSNGDIPAPINSIESVPDQTVRNQPERETGTVEALQKRKLMLEIDILEMKKVKLHLEQQKLRQEIKKLR